MQNINGFNQGYTVSELEMGLIKSKIRIMCIEYRYLCSMLFVKENVDLFCLYIGIVKQKFTCINHKRLEMNSN